MEGAHQAARAGVETPMFLGRSRRRPYAARYFRYQPKSTRLLLIREPWRRPVGAMHVAAATIQRWFRLHGREGSLEAFPAVRPVVAREDIVLYHVAALEIQRFVRGHSECVSGARIHRWASDRVACRRFQQDFAYLRDMCTRFQKSCSPVELLRVINPREVHLADAASGLTVMLRLGGETWPPLIYYKVFSESAVCDVGAFAPREYSKARRRPRETAATPTVELRVGGSTFKARAADPEDGWYERWENNGWRPVSTKTLAEAEVDPIARRTAARKLPWHWSKLQRRKNAEVLKREKKRQWLMRLYLGGLATETEMGAQLAETRAMATMELDRANAQPKLTREELDGMTDEELRAAAEERIREHLGLDGEVALSASAFVQLAKTVDVREELAMTGPPPLREAGCPVDFESESWEDQANSLLQWADDLDFDSYAAGWGDMGVSADP
jgi:hypothetical protein